MCRDSPKHYRGIEIDARAPVAACPGRGGPIPGQAPCSEGPRAAGGSTAPLPVLKIGVCAVCRLGSRTESPVQAAKWLPMDLKTTLSICQFRPKFRLNVQSVAAVGRKFTALAKLQSGCVRRVS